MTSKLPLLLILILLSSGCAHSADRKTREPIMRVQQAISVAETWTRSHKVDLSGMFLQRVIAMHDVKDPSKTGWSVTWAPSDPFTLDGEFSVYVYDNGQIKSDEL